MLDQITSRSASDLEALHQAIGNKQTAAPGGRILEAVVLAGHAESNSEAKQLIKNCSIFLNERCIGDMHYLLTDRDFIQGKIALLRKGKKARGSIWKA